MPTRFDEMQQQCQAFHEQNPRVWELFVKFTFDRIEKGFEHYSVNSIFERIRWETDVAQGPNVFKLNNNYRPFYARRFMRMYPEYSGFFRTREQVSKHKPQTGLPELTPDDYPTWPQPPRQIAP